MTIEEIKAKVLSGTKVYWANRAYEVKNHKDQWLVECSLNGHCIGLTNQAGDKLNGREDDFFTDGMPQPMDWLERMKKEGKA